MCQDLNCTGMILLYNGLLVINNFQKFVSDCPGLSVVHMYMISLLLHGKLRASGISFWMLPVEVSSQVIAWSLRLYWLIWRSWGTWCPSDLNHSTRYLSPYLRSGRSVCYYVSILILYLHKNLQRCFIQVLVTRIQYDWKEILKRGVDIPTYI